MWVISKVEDITGLYLSALCCTVCYSNMQHSKDPKELISREPRMKERKVHGIVWDFIHEVARQQGVGVGRDGLVI